MIIITHFHLLSQKDPVVLSSAIPYPLLLMLHKKHSTINSISLSILKATRFNSTNKLVLFDFLSSVVYCSYPIKIRSNNIVRLKAANGISI